MKKFYKILTVALTLVLLITSVTSVYAAPKTGKLKDVGIKIATADEVKSKSLNLNNIKETNMKNWSDCFSTISYQSLFSGACVIEPNQPKYVYYSNAITVNGTTYDLRVDVNRTTPKINSDNTMVLDSGTWPREYLNVAVVGKNNLVRLYAQNDGGSNDSKFDVVITFYKDGKPAVIKNSLIGFFDPDYANYYFDTNRAIYYRTAPNTNGSSSIEDVYNVTANGLVRYDRMSQDGFSAWQDALFAVEIKNESSFNFTIEGQSDLLILPTFYTIERKYDITYKNLRGASNSNPTEYISGREINIANPGNIDGYTFVGWEEGNKIGVDDFGDKVFTAVWDPYKYKINYDGNGAENTMESSMFTFEDEAFNSKENEFVKAQHKFIGFKVEGIDRLITTPENFKEVLLAKGNGGEITLVAQWEYIAKTFYLDVKNESEIIPNKEGKFEQPEEIENYVFVETKNQENGDIIHYYHQLQTMWVDEEDKALLEPKVGLHEKEDIEDYKFVKTEEHEYGDLKHIYHLLQTEYIDEDGNQIIPSKQGIHEKEDIENYVFVKSNDKENGDKQHVYHMLQTHFVDESDKNLSDSVKGLVEPIEIETYKLKESKELENGDLKHIYRKLMTNYVDTSNKELLPSEQERLKPKQIDNYVYIESRDEDNGDITHIYHVLETRFVEEITDKDIVDKKLGLVDKMDIKNYLFVKTEKVDDFSHKHIYHKLMTSFVDENNKQLIPSQEGTVGVKEISGYTHIETKTLENGDTVHIYQALVKLTFIADGKVLKENMLKKGSDGIAPSDPVKQGYKFKGWDKSYKNIQQDTIVTAIFEKEAEEKSNNQNIQPNPKNQTKVVNTGVR